MEQAQGIARREVEKMHQGEHLQVHTPKLVEAAYWRVIIESTGSGPRRYLTNLFPGVLSRQNTEAIAQEQAQLQLGSAALKVQATERIQGPFWRVLVWRLPAMPEGFDILDISPKDGTVVYRF